MTDERFDLDAYVASKRKLDFDPELGKATVTFVPGAPRRIRTPQAPDEPEGVFFIEAILDSLVLDEAPYDAYPFVPPVILGWKSISSRQRAEVAHKLLNSHIVYDETHPKATADGDRDLAWARVLMWYLVTTIAGNVPIKVCLKGSEDAATILADDLIEPEDKAVMSLRNAYMTNFSVIGMKIVNAHMPAERPDIRAFSAATRPGVNKFLRDCSAWIRFPAGERKNFDLWAAHANWLNILLAFAKSTEAQRSVLYRELLTAENHETIIATLGDNIVSDTFVHPARGQVLRDRHCGGFILEMIVRGLLSADMEAKTVNLTDEGRALISTLSPLEDRYRYLEFMHSHDDKVALDRLPEAHEWIIEFFTEMKKIAGAPTNKDSAE
ncbi:hypothetical protein D3C71_153940 [compost metagenome]